MHGAALLALSLITMGPALAQFPSPVSDDALRAAFQRGREAIRECLPFTTDRERYTDCAGAVLMGVGRPDQPLRAMFRTGVAFEEFLHRARARDILTPSSAHELDLQIARRFEGSRGRFCGFHGLDCAEFQRLWRGLPATYHDGLQTYRWQSRP